MRSPNDLDAARAAIATSDAYPQALQHLTTEIATGLEFSELTRFKALLKRFFSPQPWTADDAADLATLIGEGSGSWSHDLGSGYRMDHGFSAGRYHLSVTGGSAPQVTSVFDRVFSGPVRPEATPHPRKVKFLLGGAHAPGVWYLADEPDPADARVARLFGEADVTDVMVAGDFVTIGLARTASWEDRLEPLLHLVTDLFEAGDTPESPTQSRDELIAEAGGLHVASTELHLLDPDDRSARHRLEEALNSDDARSRRTAVAVLAQSSDASVATTAIRTGAADPSKLVRRAAIDSGADVASEELTEVFTHALGDEDPWIRWKAIRALRDRDAVAAADLTPLLEDNDFQVRMEAEAALRD